MIHRVANVIQNGTDCRLHPSPPHVLIERFLWLVPFFRWEMARNRSMSPSAARSVSSMATSRWAILAQTFPPPNSVLNLEWDHASAPLWTKTARDSHPTVRNVSRMAGVVPVIPIHSPRQAATTSRIADESIRWTCDRLSSIGPFFSCNASKASVNFAVSRIVRSPSGVRTLIPDLATIFIPHSLSWGRPLFLSCSSSSLLASFFWTAGLFWTHSLIPSVTSYESEFAFFSLIWAWYVFCPWACVPSCRVWALHLLFPIACYGVTIEIPPLKKGVRGIWRFRFPLNTPEYP